MQNISFTIILILIALFVNDNFRGAFCRLGALSGGFRFDLGTPVLDGLLLFAAGDQGEKTEEATAKKKRDAKKKGQVSKSKELNSLAGLITIIVILISMGSKIIYSLEEFLVASVNGSQLIDLTVTNASKVIGGGLARVLYTVSIVLIPIVVVGVGVNIAQVGFIFSGEPIKFDIKKINPIAGFKRIFSKKTLFEFVKNITKLALITYIVFSYFNGKKDELIITGMINHADALTYMGNIVIGLLFRIAFVFVIIGVMDFAFEKYSFKKQQKMSKQEIKEEYKEMEGDPHIKSRRRQKQKQISYNRMMTEIPEASVVITNPTHFAVAIRYDEDRDEVPIVVAKGVDFLAQKIKEVAKENGVEIVENKPLARTLYKEVEIDQHIPVELYQVMAEILSVVYNKKKGI